jgi:excisionase family DNA binding protein
MTSTPVTQSSDTTGEPRSDRPAPFERKPMRDAEFSAQAGDRLVLSVAEVGDLLGLSRAFAYELVARGELPVIRFGRRIVVPKAALLELLASAAPER